MEHLQFHYLGIEQIFDALLLISMQLEGLMLGLVEVGEGCGGKPAVDSVVSSSVPGFCHQCDPIPSSGRNEEAGGSLEQLKGALFLTFTFHLFSHMHTPTAPCWLRYLC